MYFTNNAKQGVRTFIILDRIPFMCFSVEEEVEKEKGERTIPLYDGFLQQFLTCKSYLKLHMFFSFHIMGRVGSAHLGT